MFLNIRTFILALLVSSTLFAQEEENIKSFGNTTQEEVKKAKNIGNISLSPYLPIAFGDNFVTNGLDLTLGARLSFKINAYQDFYVGPYFSFFSGWVDNPELLGNYYGTTNYVVGALIGYEKHINKFDLSVGLGVGASTYRNHGTSDYFSDSATTVWLNPEVSYRFSTYLGVFITPELRHDFMNIDVPAELKDTFKNVNYLNLSLGLRINLGTAYRYY